MRTEFVHVKTRKQAEKLMPWASYIVKVCGGYKGFESFDDYMIWVDHKPNRRHRVAPPFKVFLI